MSQTAFYLEKSGRKPSAFLDHHRNLDFFFFHKSFVEVGAFLGLMSPSMKCKEQVNLTFCQAEIYVISVSFLSYEAFNLHITSHTAPQKSTHNITHIIKAEVR